GESSTSSARSGLGTGTSRCRGYRRQLVEDGPERSELLDRLHELAELHRLDDVGVHAQLVAAQQVDLLAGRGQHHHRRQAQLEIVVAVLGDQDVWKIGSGHAAAPWMGSEK